MDSRRTGPVGRAAGGRSRNGRTHGTGLLLIQPTAQCPQGEKTWHALERWGRTTSGGSVCLDPFQLFRIGPISSSPGTLFYSEKIFEGDKIDLDAPEFNVFRVLEQFPIRNSLKAGQKIDPVGLYTKVYGGSLPLEILARDSGTSESEIRQHAHQFPCIVRRRQDQKIDILGQSRIPVVIDGVTTDEHITNPVFLEKIDQLPHVPSKIHPAFTS